MIIHQNLWQLKHPAQCPTCPWVKGHSLSDIPGYDRAQHLNLSNTISTSDVNAQVEALHNPSDEPRRIMQCHYAAEGEPRYCIGWLHNQITIGNNLEMRVRVMHCTNLEQITLAGEQVDSFEQTLEDSNHG